MGLKVMNLKKTFTNNGVEAQEKKITHFFLIKITKMYNDNFVQNFLGGL